MGVQDPLCDAAPTEISGTGDHVPQGVTKVVVPEPISARAAEPGSDRASSALPGLLQPIVPCSQGNGGVEADHRSVLPQCLRALPELHYGDASVNPQGPSTGPVVNLPRSERCLLSHRDPPSRQTLPTLLSQRHLLAVHSTAIRVVNQSESIYQNTQTGTSLCPPPSGKAAHVLRRLVAKPRDSPGSSRANILAQVPVPKARVGYKPREVGSNPFSGFHVSGDRAGHLCRPSKAVTQEVDQLAIRSGGIHSTAVTTCCPVAPSTWTPSLPRETSALRSNSHSSHSMAIETPVEPVEGEILKTDPTRPSVPPGHPMVDQQGKFTKGSPSRDHRCGVLPVFRQQYSGLGCPFAGSNCIWHLVPGPGPTTHQCPGASSHMAWPKSFQPESGEYEGCAHVRQHVSGCLPEKSGGHQIARNERFSHGHMSVGREEGNDSSSPLSSRASECVSGPSVPEGSNPQDRMEPKPDCSRQDLSCLGQTIRGSVRPREEHEIGNIRLPHSGGDVLESGQSCPELGRPVRVCVPSDKPDKGLSKQGQNRKRRDRPNSASLAQPGMVSGPPRSLNRLSNISPTSAETAQADLLTPLSSASVASQPSRLEVIKGFHKERGFSEAVAQRLAISQRQSSAVVYESKWKVFGEWCHVKQIDPVKATVQQLADFLIFLFEEKKLAISSIQGYRSCISKVFLARGIDISHDRDLNMLVRNFAIERPVQHREAPRWDLMVVLRLLMKPPFEPMNMASLADMTRKLAFLLTLATAKRNSEVWAFSADVRFGQDYNAATLSFLPNFLAKTMDPSRPETDYAPVTIPALGPSMGEDLPDRFLCPVRALRYYLKLKHKGLDPNNRFRRLLCAFKLGHIGDISKQTVSGWIRQLIKQAYSAVQDEDIPHLTHTNFQARELRAFASSLAFHQNYSLKQVMEAASWRNNNTFVSFYLRDLSQMGDVTTAGPFVAGQKVISC